MKPTIFLIAIVALSLSLGAAELVKTKSGNSVVLKDDHTWELFDPSKHLALRDLRASNEQIQISIKYKSYSWLSKEVRSVLEAEYADEQEIKDSLRFVPKGGLLYFRIEKKYIHPQEARYYTYTIWDSGKKPFFQKDGSDREAVDSDDGGYADLLVLPIQHKPKGKVLKVQVQDRVMKQIWEYEVPIDDGK